MSFFSRRQNKGFTVLELLVIIAIIGIMSAIILVMIGNTRQTAKDAHIIADARQMRNLLALGFDGTNYSDLWANSLFYGISFDGVNHLYTLADGCSSDGPDVTGIKQIIDDVNSQGGVVRIEVYSTGENNWCGRSHVTSYAIYSRLASDSSKAFCVDSSGRSNLKANMPVGVINPDSSSTNPPLCP